MAEYLLLGGVIIFAVGFIADTMKFAGGWVLFPVILVTILAFIAGKMREGW